MVIYNYWYGIIFFYFSYHLGVYNEDIAILDTTMVLVFDSILLSMPLGSIYHARTFMPRQRHLNINMVENGVEPNNISDIIDFVILTYPPNVIIWLELQIWYHY